MLHDAKEIAALMRHVELESVCLFIREVLDLIFEFIEEEVLQGLIDELKLLIA